MINGELTDDLIREGWQSMVDLDISANRLEGPLPSMIWSMPLLEVVDIHGNDFNGQIPEVVGVARNLVYVGVQDNSLDGTIPESISNMEKLRHLDVSANNLVLPFPQSMELMTTLEALYTGINGFVAHPVPAWLSVMTNLKELSMKQNQLTGAIPGFLGNLLNLQVLDLDFNKLNGAIPAVSRTLVTEMSNVYYACDQCSSSLTNIFYLFFLETYVVNLGTWKIDSTGYVDAESEFLGWHYPGFVFWLD